MAAINGGDVWESISRGIVNGFVDGFIMGAAFYCVAAGVKAIVHAANTAKAARSAQATDAVKAQAADGLSGLTKQQMADIKQFAETLPKGEYTVYLSRTDNYVGITNDFMRRSGEHFRNYGRLIFKYKTGLSKEGARVVEQLVMDTVRYTNGLNMSNIKNSIDLVKNLGNLFLVIIP